MTFDGAILVGGASRRMGTDKAAIPFGRETALQRQARVLRTFGVQQLFIVENTFRHPLPGARSVADDPVACGPLAGAIAALSAGRSSHLALVAVDLPQLNLGWWRWLAIHSREKAGAIAGAPGEFEPLAAIYPRTVLPAMRAHASHRRFDLQSLAIALVFAGKLRALPVPAAGRWQLLNCNTPADLASVS